MRHVSSPITHRRGLTLDQVYVWVALSLIALRPLMTPIPPYDFWWHMKYGELIATSGSIPTTDPFSFTQAGKPFFNQGWLAQLLMYGLHQLGGLPLIIVTQAVIIALAYGLLLHLVIRRTRRLRMSVALLLLAVVPISFDNWLVRPQSYTLPIFIAFLSILTGYRLRWWRRLWLLPLLMVLWVNLHGSFVLGLALIAIIFSGEALRRLGGVAEALTWVELRQLVVWGALSALAILLNPRGLEVVVYVRDLLSSTAVTTLVSEWASPTPRTLSGALFFIFVIGLFLLLIYARERPELTDLLLLLPFLWLGLGAVRNVIWVAIVAYPLLAQAVASHFGPPRRSSPGSPAANALLAGMLGMLLLLGLPWVKPALGLPPKVGALVSPDTPLAAVAELRSLPPEERPRRLFHLEGFGSYLIWAAPNQPVFIDPRIEFYPHQQWADMIDLSQARNVDELLAKYQIDGMLLSPQKQEPLLRYALETGRWRVAYEDDAATLLLPSNQSNGAPSSAQ